MKRKDEKQTQRRKWREKNKIFERGCKCLMCIELPDVEDSGSSRAYL